jgi:mono/diheme cytochrome c family protein
MMHRRWIVISALVSFAALFFRTAYAQGNVDQGKQLFLKNCAVCHGEDARGRVGPTLRQDFPGIRVDLFLKQTISNGVDGSVMPAWSRAKGGPLTDAEIDDLVAFIRSLGRPTPPINVTPPPTGTAPLLPSPVAAFPAGDATRGAQVYKDNCEVCHGDRGQGNIGATLRRDWPGINPEAFIEATVARGVAGSKMPAWAQSNGGPLTNQQIADVATYIRTLRPAPQPTAAPSIPSGGLFGNAVALVIGILIFVVGAVVLGVGLMGRQRSTKRK